MIKYVAASARCRLHIVKLRVMSQFKRKSSDIWTNMSTGMEQVARHNPISQQKPLGQVKLVRQKPGMHEVQGSNLAIIKFWLKISDYFIYLKYLRQTYNIAIDDIA